MVLKSIRLEEILRCSPPTLSESVTSLRSRALRRGLSYSSLLAIQSLTRRREFCCKRPSPSHHKPRTGSSSFYWRQRRYLIMMNHTTQQTPPQTQNPQATLEMCLLCFDVLLLKLQRGSRGDYQLDLMTGMPLYPGAVGVKCPLFVTWDVWRHGRWELRGCIGSLQPLALNKGVPKYALTSALQDRRFQPIVPQEVPHLRAKVSLLVQYEPCAHVYDWIVGVHGIMIEWSDDIPADAREKVEGFNGVDGINNARRYSATYLPEVAAEQGWDARQAVESLIRKAGFNGPVMDELLGRIKCTRYQSSKCAADFRDYCHARQQQMTGGSIEPQALQAYQVATSQANKNNCNIM